MKSSFLIVLISVFLFSCAGRMSKEERVKEYILNTNASQIIANNAILEMIETRPTIQTKSKSNLIHNMPVLELDEHHPELFEITVHGAVHCQKNNDFMASFNNLLESEDLVFSLTINIKDKRIRMSYSDLKLMKNQNTSAYDFNPGEDMNPVLNRCLVPLNDEMVAYINQKAAKDNW